MKFLDGTQLADFIKTRQTKALRSLKQVDGLTAKLAIIVTIEDQVIDTYIRLKEEYAADIGASVAVYRIQQAEAPTLLDKLTKDDSIHGIIIQLPLAEPNKTDKLCQLIPTEKDIDGLNPASSHDSAAATAVNWLLAGYGIDLHDKKLIIIGKGKLIGKPLFEIWQASGLQVTSMDEKNLSFEKIKQADVVVTATGKPGLIKAEHLAEKAVVIDAGTTLVGKNLVGDIDPEVYEIRDDLTITPQKGGVGPMTITILFEHLIIAATTASLAN